MLLLTRVCEPVAEVQPELVVSGLKGQLSGFDAVVWLRSKSDPCSQVKNICEKFFVLAGLEKTHQIKRGFVQSRHRHKGKPT